MQQQCGELLHSPHVLAATNEEDASFDPDRIAVDFEEMSWVGLAIVRIVERPRPPSGAVRHHGAKNLDAKERPIAHPRIGIIIVSPRRAGGRINR
jgi:hypothetical protein